MRTPIDIKSLRDTALAVSNGPFNVHDNLKGLSVDELKEISLSDRLPWHTLCLNLTGDLNIGTIIRTSHCMGATSVIIFGRRKIDNRGIVGSDNYIRVERISAVDEKLIYDTNLFVSYLKEKNLTPVFVETGGILLSSINWKTIIKNIHETGNEICLIMGNETDGIPTDILNVISEFPNSFKVSIPQRGVIRSVNVSVAHAMIVSNMCSSMEWF